MLAEKNLMRYEPLFISIYGRAEATNMKPSSIGLVVACQELHWFDLYGAQTEFTRILRKYGFFSIIYNHRRKEDGAEKAYSALTSRYSMN